MTLFYPQKNPNFMDKYFPEGSIEYPDITSDPLLPIGTLYEYVSHTFLNGWVNYVKIKRLLAIPRYSTTTQEFYSGLLKFASQGFHTNLGYIGDDVLAVGIDKEATRYDRPANWWFFWFDRDVSDCCIGRMKVTPEDDPAADLHLYLEPLSLRNNFPCDPIDINPDLFLKGWISF